MTKALLLFFALGTMLLASQNSIQVWSADNSKGKITTKSIEEAFNSVGLDVLANNNMNKPFKLRFKKTHYKVYNLAIFMNNDLTLKLIKKYPQFGVLSPMTMSIWSDGNTMNISTLSLKGMSRTTGVPFKDKTLREYAVLIQKALKKAMPHGHFKKLPYKDHDDTKSYLVSFSMPVEYEEDQSPGDFEENFEDEFTGELEPIGFLFPNYLNLKEDIFEDAGYDKYDFFNTLSICKFDVIFPVSKLHPEVGAYAPCTFYIYKKKDEKEMHMGFLGVENWIETADIHDDASIKPLKEAQGMIKKVIEEMK